ncbi:hypothetical protein Tco_1155671 [Tanacetum coccineum]
MDDPNITMEEYIRLEEEKARRQGRTFNWQTTRYGKMEYYENEDDSFTDFKTEYSAIVLDDAFDTTLSCEPTLSAVNIALVKAVGQNGLAPLPHRDLRHPWLRYQVDGYDEGIVHSYEQRLETIWGRLVNRVHVLDFAGLTDGMRQTLGDRLSMVYAGDDGEALFTSCVKEDLAIRKIDDMCAGDVVDFRTWPGISLETTMMSTMDLDGETFLTVLRMICEDMLKGAYFGAKKKTFEDYSFLTNTPYPAKEYGGQRQVFTRKRVFTIPNTTYSPSAIRHMEEDHKIPIILGRPFLATAHAMIDVFNKKISFKVRNEMVTFDIEKSMRFASPEDDSYGDDEADQITDTWVFSSQGNGGPVEFGKSTLFTANTKEPEKQIPKLKELPSHLKYQGHQPVIFHSQNSDGGQFKPIVQPQRKLNPKVQDVVKDEIVKLLDAGLIYAIYDSPWLRKIRRRLLSPAHMELLHIDECPLDYATLQCEETNIVLNWEQCHFMVKEGIILEHKISKSGIKVDRAKVDVIAKLPYHTNVKGVKSFLGACQILPKDKKGTENLAADHLSRLENPELEKLKEEAIRESFPEEHLMAIHVREPEADPCCKEFLNVAIWGRPEDIMVSTLLQERYLNQDSTNQLSLKMPQDMFENAMPAIGHGISLPAIRCP